MNLKNGQGGGRALQAMRSIEARGAEPWNTRFLPFKAKMAPPKMEKLCNERKNKKYDALF